MSTSSNFKNILCENKTVNRFSAVHNKIEKNVCPLKEPFEIAPLGISQIILLESYTIVCGATPQKAIQT